MVLPYEIYFRFLVLKKRSHTNICNLLESYDLIPPTKAYFNEFKKGLLSGQKHSKIKTYFLSKAKDTKAIEKTEYFKQWLTEVGIAPLWYEKGVGELLSKQDLLSSIRGYKALRMKLDQLILTRKFSDEQICSILIEEFRVRVNPNHIYEYRQFIWNDSLLTKQDWITYINKIPDEEERLFLLRCLETSRENENLIRLGVIPDADMAAKKAQLATMFLEKAELLMNTGAPAYEIQRWIELAEKVQPNTPDRIEDDHVAPITVFNSVNIENSETSYPSVEDVRSRPDVIDISSVKVKAIDAGDDSK